MNKYKNKPDYVTFKEAVCMVGKSATCFRKYAERLQIYGEREGRCTYFHRKDIETLHEFFGWGAQDLIARLEVMTGKKVKLITIQR